MIQLNHATRPFYNQRAVAFWLGVGGVVAVAATAFNVSRVMRYSGSNTELVTQASQDEAAAAEARRAATQLRAGIDTKRLDDAAQDAKRANDLIDRRTFSWTELFNRFETTLPDDVRITSVTPKIDSQQHIVLTVIVLARGVDDVNAFMEHLDSTGVFRDLRSIQEQTNDDDQIQSVLEMTYLAPTEGAPGTAAVEPRR